jgi:hypothetical protein
LQTEQTGGQCGRVQYGDSDADDVHTEADVHLYYRAPPMYTNTPPTISHVLITPVS